MVLLEELFAAQSIAEYLSFGAASDAGALNPNSTRIQFEDLGFTSLVVSLIVYQTSS